MSASHLNLFGTFRQTSFFYLFLSCSCWSVGKNGIVTSVIINLSSSSEIRLDDKGDFYLLSEINDFKIL